MEVSLTQFKIIFKVNIGVINKKKADVLSNEFKENFPIRMLQEHQGSNAFMLIRPENKEAFIIEHDKITYQLDNETSEPDFEFISKIIANLFQLLMLDEKCNAGLRIVGLISSNKGNSMEESLDKLLVKDIKSKWKELQGVGLRFLYNKENSLWEYKLEPLIKDSRLFYIEMIGNVNNPKDFNEIIRIAQSGYNEYYGDKLEILKLFLKG